MKIKKISLAVFACTLNFILLFGVSLKVLGKNATAFMQNPAIKAATPAAQKTFPQYEIGAGGKYQLQVGNDPSDVTMAVISRTDDRLVIEILIESKNDSAALGVKMWQQFHLKLVDGKIQIEKGIMKIPQIGKPQIFPNEYLQGYSGVKMQSFLINSEKDMSGKKIATESVTTDGGTFQTSHYRHSENSQTLDFWIAQAAKPFGLVKMNSVGGQFGQTYNMTFKGSVSGYKSQIDATQAEPLSDMAKAFLPLLGPGLFQN